MPPKKDNSALDTQVLAAIKEGKSKFHDIWIGTNETQRVIDKRLQDLRKRGLIQYHSKSGWTIVVPEKVDE